MDGNCVIYGSEPVRQDGKVIGQLCNGGYGYTARKNVDLVYLPKARI